MLRRALFAAAAGGLFLVVACAEEKPAQSPVDVLKDRATSDLKCPSEEIHTKTVDNRVLNSPVQAE